MKIVFLGPPGAGKGTIASRIIKDRNIPQISTGDIFRAAIKNQTELGKKVKAILDSGELVPDTITIEIVKERLKQDDAKNGFILDGFPRTIPQAEALDTIIDLRAVINFVISDEQVIGRLSGRRICPKCRRIYHVETLKPKQDGICDDDSTKLIQREDDSKEAIMHRLDVYKNQTEPLIEYYRNKGILKDLDASSAIETIMNDVNEILS
jgi:adenylate kinase